MNDEMTMPVFKPMRKRRMLLGLGLKEWMRVAFALIVGAALAFSLGSWKHEVEVALTATELQEAYGHYSLYQNALQKADQMRSASGASDMPARSTSHQTSVHRLQRHTRSASQLTWIATSSPSSSQRASEGRCPSSPTYRAGWHALGSRSCSPSSCSSK